MEDFAKYLGINRTVSLICCIFWIFSAAAAEGNTVSKVVGSTVILHCHNDSISTLSQLTWKMNRVTLFSLIPQKPSHVSQEALSLNINMSESESQLYALIIESVQTSHTGNYTCETNTDTGAQEQKWELIITEHVKGETWDKLITAVAFTVPCVCCLIFIIAFTILQRVCKQRAKNVTCAPSAEMQERSEHIYENCLETDASRRRGYNQSYHYNTKTH